MKILLDGEIKRTKQNVLTGKNKNVYETSVNNHNYGVTLKLCTKTGWQVFFTLNNEDIERLILQKEREHIERVQDLS